MAADYTKCESCGGTILRCTAESYEGCCVDCYERKKMCGLPKPPSLQPQRAFHEALRQGAPTPQVMKKCVKCNAELDCKAAVCPKCGCATHIGSYSGEEALSWIEAIQAQSEANYTKCESCGGTILRSTAESYGGRCVDCYERLGKMSGGQGRSKRPSDREIAREYFELFRHAAIRFAVAHVEATDSHRGAEGLAPAVADYAMSTASAQISRKYGLSRNEMIEIIGIAMDESPFHARSRLGPDAVGKELDKSGLWTCAHCGQENPRDLQQCVACAVPKGCASSQPPAREHRGSTVTTTVARGDPFSSAKPIEAKVVAAISGVKRLATQATRLGPILGRSAQFVRSASEHGCHFAYAAILTSGKSVVVFDGQRGADYDAVAGLLLSPEGGRVAYAVAVGTRQFVIVDGRAGRDHVVVFDLKFSPDGRRLAYIAGNGKKQFVVLDGQIGPEFDGIAQSSLNFSADSKRFGYGAARDNKFLVVVDDQPGSAYELIGEGGPTFSPDGNRVAYAAKKQDRWMVVIDGDPGPEYDGILAGTPVFSPDGTRVAYGAQLGSRYRVLVDGQPGPEYETIGKGSLVFSPDSKRLRYVVRTENNWMAVVDGSLSPPYDMIGAGDPVFSTDGRRVAYAAKKANKWTVVVDGEPGPEHDDILEGTPRFSPDGDRLAYGARRMSKWMVVVDGQAGSEFETLLAGTPVFSPNGKRVAYGGRRTNTWVAVVDGQLGLQYDGIGIPVFSPDSQHVLYVAAKTGKQLVVADERAGPEHEGVVSGPVFRADGIAEWIARNEESLYRVTCCTDSPCEPRALPEAPAREAGAEKGQKRDTSDTSIY